MKANRQFANLLEPSRIGSVRTRNRMMKSAVGLLYWGKGENPVIEKAMCLYEALAGAVWV